MSNKIHRPSEVKRLPRLFFYAGHKKGKSKLCTTVGQGKVLFLDPEHGTDWMKSSKLDPHVWTIDRWEDLDEAYQFLKNERHSYQWVTLDGLTRINSMSIRYILRKSMEGDLKSRPALVQRKIYYQSGEQMKTLLHNFHSLLDMGVIFTSQERIIVNKQFEGEEDEDEETSGEVCYVPDLPAGVRGAVNSLADVIGRLYIANSDGQRERRLWLEPSILYDTGYRSNFVLPPYLSKPTIPRLIQAIEQGKVSR